MSATEAKKNFGDLMINIIREPVCIKKHNKKYAIILPYEKYQDIEFLEDQMLGKLAKEARKKGKYLSAKESAGLMNKWLRG